MLALALVAVTIAALLFPQATKTKALKDTACTARKKDDCKGACTWVVGDGCHDKDPQRYFAKELPTEGQEKFCRCALHLMAKGVRNPHAVCARTTKTSTGGKPCFYDFDRIPMEEVRAYAKPLGLNSLSDTATRRAMRSWYESKKRV